jgi:hypothetical protein
MLMKRNGTTKIGDGGGRNLLVRSLKIKRKKKKTRR